MAGGQQSGNETSGSYEPGTVDENNHGWAPDTGQAKERVIEANKKAWEANDTQEAAPGAARQGPDMTGGHVGESITQHGEDVVKDEGKKTAPTRPHPHTPPSPGALKTAGPIAAAADKARDAVTGRGD